MNIKENIKDFDIEIQKLLNNIENIKADIDLYGMLVDETLLVTTV